LASYEQNRAGADGLGFAIRMAMFKLLRIVLVGGR